jgi:Arc/MetJ-type ribon-helix-helix transcriptional regulator
MKQKLSVSIDEETIGKLDGYVSEGSFRNKSHVVEFALNKMMKEKENEQTN